MRAPGVMPVIRTEGHPISPLHDPSRVRIRYIQQHCPVLEAPYCTPSSADHPNTRLTGHQGNLNKLRRVFSDLGVLGLLGQASWVSWGFLGVVLGIAP